MKTKFMFFAAAAIATVSCTKVDTENAGLATGSNSFTATVEDQATKTSLNKAANGLLWKTGDEVEIWGSTTNKTYLAQNSGASTKLTGEDVGDAPYAAYYPAAKASAWDGTKFTVEFPAEQTYTADDIADKTYPMIGYITEGTNFSFKNVAGIVCVKVKAAYDNIKVQSVKVESTTRNLSGAATVAWNNGTPSVEMTGNAAADKAVTLDCSAANENSGVAISSSTYMPFYFVVPAGTDAANSFKVTVTGTIQNKAYTATQTLTAKKSIEIVRSALTSIQLTASNLVFDLSKQNGISETANCYLIKEPGKYKFPVTVKGNGVLVENSGITSPAIDASTIKSSGIYYTDGTSPISGEITVADGYATFATPATLAGGNALFGVFSATGTVADNVKGNCIWSWDIWANPTASDVTTGAYTFLSCHVGATADGYLSTGTDGYFFQWGRKDPFPQGNKTGALGTPFVQAGTVEATMTDAVNNPTHWYMSSKNKGSIGGFPNDWLTSSCDKLWDNDNDDIKDDDVVKTMFDPCPVGYHVMSGKALAAIVGGSRSVDDNFCFWFGVSGTKVLQWPSCGSRGLADGNLFTRGRGNADGFLGWSAYSHDTQYANDLYGNSVYANFGKYLGFPVRPQKN